MGQVVSDQHDKLIELIEPIIAFMEQNKFNFMIVAGKDGTCARYCNGNKYEIMGMLSGMVKKHPNYTEIFLSAAEDTDQ
jgi:hypothetical protein